MTSPPVAGAPHLTGTPFVTRIEIEDLFGLYNYRLGSGSTTPGENGRLFLLYGDNGSGKTTVLRLVFSLLSAASGQGHRSFIAQVPFRRLSVRLGDDLDINVLKSGTDAGSPYRIQVARGDAPVLDVAIEITAGQRVTAANPGLDEYLGFLRQINISLYYLADDRKGKSSMGEDATHENERRLFRIQQEELLRTGRVLQGRHLQPQADEALELAIGRFASWVRSQALTGSTTGEMNANTVYADIVKRIMRPTRRGRPAANEPELDKLLRALSQLEQENRAYAQFGLTSPLSMDALVSAAQDATANTRRILAGVLQPYVDGLRARLTALASVQRLLTVFVDSANSFLSNKSISFNLRQGLRIQTVTGAPLKARMLSSGERQLLLLLCNTAVAREQASIFIIDEPEISLNVKWQRKLLDALLKLTADSDVQFVIATHSVELLARHMASVSKLAHEAVESS